MTRLIHRAAALATILLVATVAQPALAAKTVLNIGMAAIDAGRLDPHLSATTPDKVLFGMDVQRPRADEARHDES